MVDIPLRDALYAIFRKALAASDPAADFEAAARALEATGGRRSYLEDRIPRFLAVLRDAGGRDVDDSFERTLRMGRKLFNHGLYFDCHEYLEQEWRRSQPPRKTVLQGLIQAGAGFHKWESGSPGGAVELLISAAEKLESSGASVGGRFDAFARDLRRVAEVFRSGERLAEFPKM